MGIKLKISSVCLFHKLKLLVKHFEIYCRTKIQCNTTIEQIMHNTLVIFGSLTRKEMIGNISVITLSGLNDIQNLCGI